MRQRLSSRRPHFAALVLLVTLANVAASLGDRSAADTDSHLELDIGVGRLGAMLDKADELLNALQPSQSETAADLLHRMKAQVFQYNIVLMQACDARQIVGKVCDRPYLPAWLNEPGPTHPSDVRLRAISDEMRARIEPLWSALCEKGKANDPRACDIE